MAVKNQKGAIWALAAAGGLWAWQNRDKIRGFVEQQRGNIQQQMSQGNSQSRLPSYSTPATGATQRIGEFDTNNEFTNETRTGYDPAI